MRIRQDEAEARDDQGVERGVGFADRVTAARRCATRNATNPARRPRGRQDSAGPGEEAGGGACGTTSARADRRRSSPAAAVSRKSASGPRYVRARRGSPRRGCEPTSVRSGSRNPSRRRNVTRSVTALASRSPVPSRCSTTISPTVRVPSICCASSASHTSSWKWISRRGIRDHRVVVAPAEPEDPELDIVGESRAATRRDRALRRAMPRCRCSARGAAKPISERGRHDGISPGRRGRRATMRDEVDSAIAARRRCPPADRRASSRPARGSIT